MGKRTLMVAELLLLVGCSNTEQEAYNEAIQKVHSSSEVRISQGNPIDSRKITGLVLALVLSTRVSRRFIDKSVAF